MIEGVGVREATHVKIKGEWKLIVKKIGVNVDGTLRKPSHGGFSVITNDGDEVSMWDAELYGREATPTSVSSGRERLRF